MKLKLENKLNKIIEFLWFIALGRVYSHKLHKSIFLLTC